MRYALTPAAADFVRFAGLLLAGWCNLSCAGIKCGRREISREIWKFGNLIVSLQPKQKRKVYG